MDLEHRKETSTTHKFSFISIISHSFAIFLTAPKHFLKVTATIFILRYIASLALGLIVLSYAAPHFQESDPAPKTIALYLTLYWMALLTYLFLYILFVAAVVYSFACIYTGKTFNFKILVSAILRLLGRLFTTFLWTFLLMALLHVASGFIGMARMLSPESMNFFMLLGLGIGSWCLHVYIVAIWNLASVVAVMEEGNKGWAAVKKSRELLTGKVSTACGLVLLVFLCNLLVWIVCCGGVYLVIRKADQIPVGVCVVAGFVLVALLMVVKLAGLLLHVAFYYGCKAFHNEGIDKSAMYKHLGWYSGEYVPLKSGNIEMENV